MSEHIKHECGIALIRLLKPLGFYQAKIRNLFLWLKQTSSFDGKAAQSWSGWRRDFEY